MDSIDRYKFSRCIKKLSKVRKSLEEIQSRELNDYCNLDEIQRKAVIGSVIKNDYCAISDALKYLDLTVHKIAEAIVESRKVMKIDNRYHANY